jgi:hypothetical protein
MQVIIFTNGNGGVSTCIPTGEISIDAVLEKDCPKGAIIVEQSSLPTQHNDFYNAWELADGTVTVNLDKAKALTKARLRAERTPLLQAQDVAFQRAQEEESDTFAIVAEKQRLRDVTTLADSATTLEELRSLKAGA